LSLSNILRYNKIMKFLWNLLFAFLIFAIFYGVAFFTKKIIAKSLEKARKADQIKGFLSDAVYIAILIIGAVTALSKLGINTSALIASLGLGGFALGFALKDIVANFVAGILILLTEPFKTGDFIEVSGKKGEVKSINLRHTVLKDEKGDTVLIPNNSIYTTIILKKK